ncbi:ubiquitin carboxyl-terminal hydrolase-domain-containing protein [Halteromyces radiatus]|uniref:ubiquitin carboxyl-terminal hydrolase-domain-containing protein n=1 Tax=Halteromyces radiatus TaxID=101107 RepID=UPI002220AD5E|nr:ubiquitin carboxyl-terminal hydrolase-domain-containing protein [Halteromyces radiatus]KAI8082940.1 ubiquitin carboxyl-terminal hydrolase-domain-containing protein [Halteromyces radiatus]
MKHTKKKHSNNLWHRLLEHYHHDHVTEQRTTPPPLTPKQEKILQSFTNTISSSFDKGWKRRHLVSFLQDANWDMNQALKDIEDIQEASYGLLTSPPTTTSLPLLGSENEQGTSCYLDALLFAMYIGLTSFDPMLLDQEEQLIHKKHHLQRTLRLFVNKLRSGQLVKKSTVAQVRRGLEQTGWYGQDPETHHWQQEDASELFLFLTSIFELPYLPFQLRLFHGANKDMDDDRIMTDRLLPLSLPTMEKDDDIIEPLRLETILLDHFYNSVVTGVKRNVNMENERRQCLDTQEYLSTSWGSSSTNGTSDSTDKCLTIVTTNTTTPTLMDDKGKDKKNMDTFGNDPKTPIQQQQQQQQREVDAWQAMELLPFYSSSNELGDMIDDGQQHYFSPDTHLVLPIVLKRYKLNHHQQNGNYYVKDERPVQVPDTIPFLQFVNRNTDNAVCSQCNAEMDYLMVLKSVVCHQGSSPYSGHYVAYAKMYKTSATSPNIWMKLDDLDLDHRVQTDIKEETVLDQVSKNGYLFFYELNRLCDACFQQQQEKQQQEKINQNLLDHTESDMDQDDDDDDDDNDVDDTKQQQSKTQPISVEKAQLLAQEQQKIDGWYPDEVIPPVVTSTTGSHSTATISSTTTTSNTKQTKSSKTDKCLIM